MRLLSTSKRAAGLRAFSSSVLSTEYTNRPAIMSSKDTDIDLDADFVYDYYTLRVAGLAFAGIIVFLSIILLAGNKIVNCGKSKPKPSEEA
ncbi:hypothetical protein CesoFtcFv8_006250 [Champsocephalus esox]|uniref:FXYD domain-containing ion transport regulator n=1 Tax=Champsocephalus esox TaxID=159716 RepID=A0AAN8CJF0_9TELE|nr:hypothetical protein CesoFtcFv8_006250 [Champsocephalus esox]